MRPVVHAAVLLDRFLQNRQGVFAQQLNAMANRVMDVYSLTKVRRVRLLVRSDLDGLRHQARPAPVAERRQEHRGPEALTQWEFLVVNDPGQRCFAAAELHFKSEVESR